jgi:deoxyxylulose-5-phosphate synthase
MGGFGSAVLELLNREQMSTPTRVAAIPDRFFEQASQARLRDLAGIGIDSVVAHARSIVEQTTLSHGDADQAPVTDVLVSSRT